MTSCPRGLNLFRLALLCFHHWIKNKYSDQHHANGKGVPVDDAGLEIGGIHKCGDEDQHLPDGDAFEWYFLPIRIRLNNSNPMI